MHTLLTYTFWQLNLGLTFFLHLYVPGLAISMIAMIVWLARTDVKVNI